MKEHNAVSNFHNSTYVRKSFVSALRQAKHRKKPKMDPRFLTVRPAIVFLILNMLIFLESGGLGQTSPASEFLILGYGKMSDFRGGTPNLCIKSERGNVCTTMFRSGQGVEWYQVYPDSLPPWKVIQGILEKVIHKGERRMSRIPWITFQGGKESGQTRYHSTPLTERNIMVPT